MSLKLSHRDALRLAAALALAVVTACGNPPATPPSAPRPRPRPAPVATSSAPEVAPAPAPAEPAPPASPAETERSRQLTRSALLLAGLPVDAEGAWSEIQAQPWWKSHAREMGHAWSAHESHRLTPLRRWAATALAETRRRTHIVFYPFGGPDSLYPTILFPDARTFVLVGLERVGAAPDVLAIAKAQRPQRFKHVASSINPMLKLSFFRTEDMSKRLRDQGVLPTLLALLARSGYRIQDVELLSVQPDGTAAPWTAVQGASDEPPGVRVTFLQEGEQPRFLFYFQENLSDDFLPQHPAFSAMIRALEPPVTFLKAASYLLHKPEFSSVRDLILERSQAVLEDDSGMPFAHFDRTSWEVRLYGSYKGPIQIFAHYRQDDLLEAFRDDGASDLDFGIGYKYRVGQSNLLLAQRKQLSPTSR